MRWLLAGCCGLALIHISAAIDNTFRIIQKPRFYGVTTSRSVKIRCLPSEPQVAASVEWYKVNEYNDVPTKGKRLKEVDNKIEIHTKNLTDGVSLSIKKLSIKDSGVYFCKINDTFGSGTELQVARPTTRKAALHRTHMKDGFIILQGLMLAVCIAAILLRKARQDENEDSIYEEPETDHIYQGLTIETCGGGLYEELSVYTQPEGAEAPWE